MRKMILAAASVCLATVGCSCRMARAGELRIIDSILISAGIGRGLASDGKYLWVSGLDAYIPMDGTSSRWVTWQMDPSDGSVSVVSTLELQPRRFHAGLAWDGSHLWSTTWYAPNEPDLVLKHAPDGTLLETFAAPGSPDAKPAGATWDGTHLWLSDRKHDVIMQVDPSDMTVISSFPHPGRSPRDLAWDGSSLWVVDAADLVIYQLDPSGELLETWNSPVPAPYGITFVGEDLWLLDSNMPYVTINKLAIPEPSACFLLASGALCALVWATQRRKRRIRAVTN